MAVLNDGTTRTIQAGGAAALDYCLNCMAPQSGDGACEQCGADGQASERVAHHLPAGSILANGRYLVGRALGQGGFGITYIGRDLTLNIRVAIKEYYPTLYVGRADEGSNSVVALNPKFRSRLETGRRRFLDEARVLAKFRGNPGIVDVWDFFEQNGTAYIVMEYLEGETLKDYLQRGTIGADRMFSLVWPILDTLELIHSNQVIHRDISPDNIMVRANGELCLMDFGAARQLDCIDHNTMSMVLKAGYAPEEQYRAKGELGPWTDIYALCATMYRAITGVSPDESLQRLMGDDMAWPRDMGISITEAQESVLKKGMAPKHSDRYQSVVEMKADFPVAGESSAQGSATLHGGSEMPAMQDALALSVVASDEPSPQDASMPLDASTEVPPRSELEPPAAPDEPQLESRSASPATPDEPQLENAPAPSDASNGQASQSEPASPDESSPHAPRRGGRGKTVAVGLAVAAVCAAVALGVFYLFAPAYAVTFDSTGGSAVEPITLSRVATAPEPQQPVRENYEFQGWYRDESLHDKAEFPLKVESDTMLYAAWSKSKSGYRVDYRDAFDDATIAESKKVENVEVDSKVTEEAPDVGGYVVDGERTAELVISGDDIANVLTFRYRKLMGYEVRYLEVGSDSEVLPTKVVGDVAEQTEVTEQAPSVEGRTLKSEPEQSITVERNAENVIVFYYEPVAVSEPASAPASSQGAAYGWYYSDASGGGGASDDAASGGASGGASSGGSGSQVTGNSNGGSGSKAGGASDIEWAN